MFHGVDIVAIKFADGPAKGPPFVGQRIQVDYFFDRAKTLNFVVVHKDDQIVELVVRCKERCFPNGAFVTFAIADEAEDAAGTAIAFCGDRHAGGDRKSVAEGAGGKFDARDILVHDVTGQR